MAKRIHHKKWSKKPNKREKAAIFGSMNNLLVARWGGMPDGKY